MWRTSSSFAGTFPNPSSSKISKFESSGFSSFLIRNCWFRYISDATASMIRKPEFFIPIHSLTEASPMPPIASAKPRPTPQWIVSSPRGNSESSFAGAWTRFCRHIGDFWHYAGDRSTRCIFRDRSGWINEEFGSWLVEVPIFNLFRWRFGRLRDERQWNSILRSAGNVGTAFKLSDRNWMRSPRIVGECTAVLGVVLNQVEENTTSADAVLSPVYN